MIDIKLSWDSKRVLLRIGKLTFHLSIKEARNIKSKLNKIFKNEKTN